MTATILGAEFLGPALQALKNGDVVGLPTETVYGLAGDAHNPDAVMRIFATKDRPQFDPLIVHVRTAWNTLSLLAEHGVIDHSRMTPLMQATAKNLMDAFWPGPLTLLLPKHSTVPDLVTSGLPTVGVRMPSHQVAQKVLALTGLALAAPSANRFGRISPTTVGAVFSELGERISWIIDGGDCSVGVESTVVLILDSEVQVLRPGQVSKDMLERVLQPLCVRVGMAPSRLDRLGENAAKAAPGMLASHYAPRKPLYLVTGDGSESLRVIAARFPQEHFGVLCLSEGSQCRITDSLKAHRLKLASILCLSPQEDAMTAARRLFASMRSLDDSSADVLLAEYPSSTEGLWHAIADRLSRAARPLS